MVGFLGRGVDAEPASSVENTVVTRARSTPGTERVTELRSSFTTDAEEFVEQLLPELVGMLTIRTGDRGVAEELAHEALARALADWARVSAMESARGWVYRVALNLAASRWRRQRARRNAERSLDRRDRPVHLLTAEAIAVRDALGRLSERQREVILLRFYAGFDVAEVAQALRISASTVTTQTARALRHLRIDLRDDEGH